MRRTLKDGLMAVLSQKSCSMVEWVKRPFRRSRGGAASAAAAARGETPRLSG
ncbi:hypothetical protein [Hydrogenispora ethanolica]|uniref:hypothetical protein n=1 Tax=Hydrogenispora ethanolica TaxID=1082276 RepID=UPI0014042ACA|nr:hypothetical protein [Hydrogenispora ethanolica]